VVFATNRKTRRKYRCFLASKAPQTSVFTALFASMVSKKRENTTYFSDFRSLQE
jgi:hypothetical protein